MTNTKDEYVNAASIGDKILGEIIFVDPLKRTQFVQHNPSVDIPLTECFRVTNIGKEECSILHRMEVHQVNPHFFLTRNHDYKPR